MAALDQNKIELLLEAEERGLLKGDKLNLLNEARKRGLIPSETTQTPTEPFTPTPPPPVRNTLGAEFGMGSFPTNLPTNARPLVSVPERNPVLASTPRGGFVDKSLLSGQLPLTGTLFGGAGGGILGAGAGGVGAIPGSVAGAGLGSAAGGGIERALRSLIGLDRPETIPQAFKSTAQDILSGAAAEAGGQVIGQVLKGVTDPIVKRIQSSSGKAAKTLGTSAFPQTQRIVEEQVKQGGRTLGEEAAVRGISGFKETVFNIAKAGKAEAGKQIDDILKTVDDQGIDPRKIVNQLDDIKARFLRTGDKDAVKIIEKRSANWLGNMLDNQSALFVNLDDAAKSKLLTPSQANLLKREFGSEARAVFKQGSFDAVSGVNAEFANVMRGALKKEIEKIAPSISFANKEYRFYDDLLDAVSSGIAKDLRSGGLTLRSPFTTGGAATAGGVAGGVPGAIVAGGAVQVGRSFPVKTYLASQLAKASGQRMTPELVNQVSANIMAHPTLRGAVIRALIKKGSKKK